MFWPVRVGSIVAVVAACWLIEQVALNQTVIAPRLVALAGLYVTLAVSLNLINGVTGQFSIGHAAFYQVGAYVSAYLTVTLFARQPLVEPLWLGVMVLAGMAGAGLAGLLVGLPSLRLRGDYLAIVTLGFGEIIRIVVQNMEFVGGPYGLNVRPTIPSIFGVWLLAFVCIAVCRNLLRNAHGLPFLAVRDDEVASAAIGVNVTRVKVAAFVIGSSFAGGAGALLAHYEGFISPGMFTMDLSFILLTMVVLGGSGSITGAVLAALVLFALPEYLRGAQLSFTGATLLAWAVAIALTVASSRWIARRHGWPARRRAAAYLGAIAGGYVLALALGGLLGLVPALHAAQIPGERLRLVIFAATLIVLMLLRPQGVLAHHEFSWAWVRRVLHIPGRKEAPA
jgi:branched-chain amino acid transport system permease protein